MSRKEVAIRSLAAVVACHNRRALTLNLFDKFFREDAPVRLHAYLFDDGSTDGTSPAVLAQFPQITLIAGDGSAFWNLGMWNAFEAAMNDEHDFYLWLNDDVDLDPGFLRKLVDTHDKLTSESTPVIVVGATRSSTAQEATYGGARRRRSAPYLLDMELCEESDFPQECDSFNGNCVLIPAGVVSRIGNLDPRYFHNYGDFDYGFRAKAAGCQIWQARGSVGVCPENLNKAQTADLLRSGTWRQRLKAFSNPRLIHVPSRIRYFCRQLGLWGIVAAFAPVRYLLPFAARERRAGPVNLRN